MPFNSLPYCFFLPVVFLVHHYCGQKLRWGVLLVASLLFYAALMSLQLLVVLGIASAGTFLLGRTLYSRSTARGKSGVLWGGIIFNVALLFLVKYLPAYAPDQMISLGRFALKVDFVSIGVSYYIFQAISYLVDIYFERIEPEAQFGYFFLYMAFFPKLLQGPIERGGDLLPQLKAPYRFDYAMARSGLLLFTGGLFKKMVVADQLAGFVGTVYSDVHAYKGIPLILATYAYAIQIYCDFSGYTDMALGSARLFNIHLTQNFNSPYAATSISDFWRRWHISFSRWILDYIFMPLNMLLRDWKKAGMSLALLTTFLVSGIWHGGTSGFVVWGLLHGIYLAVSVWYKPNQKKVHQTLRLTNKTAIKVWQTFFTFNLVCFAWIFFRAADLADALYIAGSLFSDFFSWQYVDVLLHIVSVKSTLVALSGFAAIVWVEAKKEDVVQMFDALPISVRWPLYYATLLSILFIGEQAQSKFLYFQF